MCGNKNDIANKIGFGFQRAHDDARSASDSTLPADAMYSVGEWRGGFSHAGWEWTTERFKQVSEILLLQSHHMMRMERI